MFFEGHRFVPIEFTMTPIESYFYMKYILSFEVV
jgi:hypothetical protein